MIRGMKRKVLPAVIEKKASVRIIRDNLSATLAM